MTLLLTLIGIALILAVFTDVFLTLFPDAGKLAVSRLVVKGFWRGLTGWAYAAPSCSTLRDLWLF